MLANQATKMLGDFRALQKEVEAWSVDPGSVAPVDPCPLCGQPLLLEEGWRTFRIPQWEGFALVKWLPYWECGNCGAAIESDEVMNQIGLFKTRFVALFGQS